jgi:integrase
VYRPVTHAEIADALVHIRDLYRQIKPSDDREHRASERREVGIKNLLSNLPRSKGHPTLNTVDEVADMAWLTIEGAHRLFGYDLARIREYDLQLNGGRTHIECPHKRLRSGEIHRSLSVSDIGYLPLKEADWKDDTAKVKKHLIETDLLAEFGEIRLERFDKLVLQAHLNKLAKTRSKDRVLQLKAYIRSIFAEAVDQDFLHKDRARKLKTPANLRETDKTVLTRDQLRSALAALELRDRILLKLDMTNALRPGELFAFRWSSLSGEINKLDIRETVYKGKIRPWAKTKGSLTAIPITEDQAAELKEWRRTAKYAAANDFIFAGRSGNFMDPSNYRKRVLHKLARELELPKLTFQVIWRTIATLAKDKGHVKDIQGMLRHSRVATTTDVYMQTMEEGVRSTVNSIHDELMGTSTTGQRPSGRRAERLPSVEGNRGGEAALAASSKRKEPGITRPLRGKVLQFATKMLPSE